MSLRGWIIGGALALGVIAGGFIVKGMIGDRVFKAEQQTEAVTDVALGNQRQNDTTQGVAEETDAFAAERDTLNKDLRDARAELDRLRRAAKPIPPGQAGSPEAPVGPNALVDPHLSRALLCRIERVRDEAQAHCEAGSNPPDRES